MSDQVTDTLSEFDDFTFAPQFEINQVVSRCSVIHSFSEIKQGFHDLARQHEADPDAQQKCEPRHYAQYPFRTMQEISSFLVILLNTSPDSTFQIRTLAAGPAGLRLGDLG